VCSDDQTEVFCEEAGTNACGGCGDEDVVIGTSCGSCAGNLWECGTGASTGELVCAGVAANICGGCSAIPADQMLDMPCGSNGCGRFDCDFSAGTTVWVEGEENGCGGCEASPWTPGESCVVCGVSGNASCSVDEVVCSASSAANACGGCTDVVDDLGEACGECGTFVCNGPDSLICSEPLSCED
jgi:hypothetical protein